MLLLLSLLLPKELPYHPCEALQEYDQKSESHYFLKWPFRFLKSSTYWKSSAVCWAKVCFPRISIYWTLFFSIIILYKKIASLLREILHMQIATISSLRLLFLLGQQFLQWHNKSNNTSLIFYKLCHVFLREHLSLQNKYHHHHHFIGQYIQACRSNWFMRGHS